MIDKRLGPFEADAASWPMRSMAELLWRGNFANAVAGKICQLAVMSKVSVWLKKVLRLLGKVFAIILITLALDYILLATVFSDLKRKWQDAASAYVGAYIHTPYHHDL